MTTTEPTPPGSGPSSGVVTSNPASKRTRRTRRPAASADPVEVQKAVIGDRTNHVVRVIAFTAGGLNNAFEFGMVHAFLVSDAPRPHIIAGTSSGALVAAMLADVLQAGEGQDDSARRLAQAGRFRSLLEQIQAAPKEFEEASFPDFTEVSAQAGLKPLNLPTQQQGEKADRKATALARYGLSRLLNGFLASRVKFRELARIVRLVLELQAIGEWRWKSGRDYFAKLVEKCFNIGRNVFSPAHSLVQTQTTGSPLQTSRGVYVLQSWAARLVSCAEWVVRICLMVWTTIRLWLQSLVPALRDAPLLLKCVLAPVREWFAATRLFDWLLEAGGISRLRDAKSILFEAWYLQVGKILLFIISYPIIILGWLFAPPAMVTWLFLNWVARLLLEAGRTRATVIRALGILILVLAGIGIFQWYPAILSNDRQLWESLFNLGHQNLWNALTNRSQVEHAILRLVCTILTWVVPGIVFAAAGMAFGPASNRTEFLALFLDGFGIKKDLLTTGVLYRLLMRAFDPYFFGKRDFDHALDAALGGVAGKEKDKDPLETRAKYGGEPLVPGQRRLGDWLWKTVNGAIAPKDNPILVAPVAADIATGRLVILEPGTSVVGALSAACALPPLFKAMGFHQVQEAQKEKQTRWLVDGSAVASEPIQPTLDLIKRLHLNRGLPTTEATEFAELELIEDVRLIDLCVMSPFPTWRLREQERSQMASDMGTVLSTGVTPEKPRAEVGPPGTLHRLPQTFSLVASHGAKDERALVTLFNAALRKYHTETGKALFCASSDGKPTNNIHDWHLSANLRELEPEKPIQLAHELARAADEAARRSAILRTVADGCRAALTGLYRNELERLAQEIHTTLLINKSADQKKDIENSPVWIEPPCRKLQKSLGSHQLPAVLGEQSPPGITEICTKCRFYTEAKASWDEFRGLNKKDTAVVAPRIPDWGKMTERDRKPPDISQYLRNLPKAGEKPEWPRERESQVPGNQRPIVSIIFSGGVFRGVFQVGVLNACVMAGIRPDVIGGASIGTIMAALSARVFAQNSEGRQKLRIARVAATFLAIDRLVLTDRFADFMRRFTLRAGSADFSLRDADHLFRQFDRRNWEMLARRSRKVLAGIHRLTYTDPLELLDLLALKASNRRDKLPDRLTLRAQDALDRAGIGSELLGAEPLEQLIKAHVLPELENQGAKFDEFLKDGMHFVATTTNLTTGELDVLGSFCNELRKPALVPGLLASSAFPGVFRPRMNWELRAGAPGLPEELVDGGISDNLPIMPVYRFLFYLAYSGWLSPRPKMPSEGNGQRPCPHLLLTASLEPYKEVLKGERLQRTAECWFTLLNRTGQLRYNVKVDSHYRTQLHIRKILEALERQSESEGKSLTPTLNLLDLHVSCVKPKWLPPTFAFHPMLGFSRTRQAQSIAHGCASTLAHLDHEQQVRQNCTKHWWKDLQKRPGTWVQEERPTKDNEDVAFTLRPHPADSEGNCCFVTGKKCPFSAIHIRELEANLCHDKTKHGAAVEPLEDATVRALDEIYQQCGRPKTHQPPRE